MPMRLLPVAAKASAVALRSTTPAIGLAALPLTVTDPLARQADGCGPVPEQQAGLCDGNSHTVRRGRFAINLSANVGTLVILLLIGLWYTPYLIRHLGVASFGLIPLTAQVTSYLTVITLVLNSAVGRYITIALERREYEEANRYFNASFFGSLCLTAALLGPAVLAASNVTRLITIPAGQEVQSGWLLGCTLCVFFLNTVLTPFGVATYSANRFDLRNVADITQRLVQIGVVVAFFALTAPRLWQVGLAIVAASLAGAVVNLRLWRKLTPALRISFSRFDFGAIRKLASFGTWVSIDQVGTLLFLAIDLVVVNRLFGPVAGGRYAAIMQWSVLLRTLATTVSVVFGPTVLYIYARNDIDGLAGYARRAMKFVGLVIALPVGLVCGLATPLLDTWLGPGFVGLAPLMSLMTIHLGVNLAVQPLFGVQQAANRVALPGLVTLAMGLGNLGLALLLAGPVRWGLYGVAAAGAMTLTARSLFFTPVYCASCLGRSAREFLSPVLRVGVVAIATAAVCYGLTRLVPLAGWLRLGAAAAAISLVYLVVVLTTQVSPEERKLVREAVRLRGVVPGLGVADRAQR